MSDHHCHSENKAIGEEAMRRLISTWVEVKILLIDKLKRRIEDENDVEKLKALRAELNEVLLNDADLAQIDKQFAGILELVKKYRAAITEMKSRGKEPKKDTPHH